MRWAQVLDTATDMGLGGVRAGIVRMMFMACGYLLVAPARVVGVGLNAGAPSSGVAT